ncbi:MAG: oligosaccharide flippase family protein [Smithellaceae bacterium]
MVRKQYLKNTLANLICNAVLVLLLLISTPILIRMLGDAQYGLYRVALVSIVGYSMILNMGFGTSVRRYFSDALHEGRIEAANDVLSVAYTFHFVQSIVIFSIFVSAAFWLPPLVKTPPEYLWAFRAVIVAAGLYVGSLFLIGPMKGVLMSHSRYDLHEIADLSFRVTLLAGGIVLMYLWYASLYALAISTLIGIAVTVGLTVVFARRVYKNLRLKIGYWNSTLFRKMFQFGRYAMMMVVGGMVLHQSPDVLIAGFLGPQSVAIYAVAAILIAQLRAVTDAFAAPLFPIASQLKADSDTVALQSLLLDGTRRCLWAWGALVCPVIIFSDSMIAAWVSPQYASSFILVWILILGDFGTALHYAPSNILNAVGSIKWLGYSQLVFSGLSLAGMIVVLWATSFGIAGVAWSLAIPTLIRGGMIVPVYTCLQMKVSLVKFYTYNLIPCAAYVLGGVLLCRMVRFWLEPVTLMPVLAAMAVCALLIAVAGLGLMLSKAERQRLLAMIKTSMGYTSG